jgi:hypothetical protein
MEKYQEDAGQLKKFTIQIGSKKLFQFGVIQRAAGKVGGDLLQRQGPRLLPDTGRHSNNKH